MRGVERTRGWDLLLLCVAGLILTSVGRIHHLFSFLEPLRPTLLLGLLGMAAYTLDGTPTRRLRGLRLPTTWLLLALAVWMALTVPTALVRYESFTFVVDAFLKTVLLYLLIVGAVRDSRDVERLTGVYFLGAVVYAVMVLLRFEIGGGDSWRLQELYTYDPNDFAVFLVTALPLGLLALTGERFRSRRIPVLAGLCAVAVAFVWAGSRGGFLALLCVILYLLVRYTAIPARWRMAASALIAIAVLATAGDAFWEQMQTILNPTKDYNVTGKEGRIQVWKRGVGYMLEHPVLGVGPTNFRAAEGMLSPEAYRQAYGEGVKWSVAHNSYLEVGVELGIPGLLLFVALTVAAFRTLRRGEALSRLGPPGPAGARLAQALRASLIGFLVGAFFLSLEYSDMLYVLIALAACVEKVARPHIPPRVAATAHDASMRARGALGRATRRAPPSATRR